MSEPKKLLFIYFEKAINEQLFNEQKFRESCQEVCR